MILYFPFQKEPSIKSNPDLRRYAVSVLLTLAMCAMTKLKKKKKQPNKIHPGMRQIMRIIKIISLRNIHFEFVLLKKEVLLNLKS